MAQKMWLRAPVASITLWTAFQIHILTLTPRRAWVRLPDGRALCLTRKALSACRLGDMAAGWVDTVSVLARHLAWVTAALSRPVR